MLQLPMYAITASPAGAKIPACLHHKIYTHMYTLDAILDDASAARSDPLQRACDVRPPCCAVCGSWRKAWIIFVSRPHRASCRLTGMGIERLETPVAFITLIILKQQSTVFAEMARIRPRKDCWSLPMGPGPVTLSDAERCSATRAIINWADWGCEVITNYKDTNLKYKQRMQPDLIGYSAWSRRALC